MKITVVGCGNMGRALARRLSASEQLFFYDHRFKNAESLEQEGLGKACRNVQEAFDQSEAVILAVKPQNLEDVAKVIEKELKTDHILISLLSGASIETLKRFFPRSTIVRMMPNLGIAYGEGVVGVCAEEKLSDKEKESLNRLFESLGKIYWINESKINALSALAGSGPAFIFVMIEAMIDAGIAMGFNAVDSQDLILQMMRGSLTLLEKSAEHPGELKWQIASPQGTTIEGIKKLEESGLRGAVMNTFLATYDRANALSKG